MSNLLTIKEVANRLKVSTKTLRRWEEKGYFALPFERDPITKARLYHPWPVDYWKQLLELDRGLRKHLKLLDGLKKELELHFLEQDYKPNQKLKLLDVEAFTKAHGDMEKWEKDFKRMINEILMYPKSMLKATEEPYENK